MKKNKWIMFILTLCMMFMFSSVVYAGEKEQNIVESDSAITKIEWIHKLAKQFNKSENSENITINDMEEKDEYYPDAAWAIGKGIVSLDKKGNFNPQKTVSKGFAAYTLGSCLDIQTEDSKTEKDVSEIPEDEKYYAYDVIAVSRGWFVLGEEQFDDSKPVTKEEINRMLEDAKTMLSIQETVKDEVASDFDESVIEVPKEKEVSIDDKGESTEVKIQDADEEIKKGDTFVVYQDSIPIVYEAQEIEKKGNDSVISASRADDDAYGELNAQGQLQLNASNAEFIPSDNVQVLSDTFDMKSGGANLEYKNGELVLSLSEGASSVNVTLSNLAINYSVTEDGNMMALTGDWQVSGNMDSKKNAIDLADTSLGEIRIYGVGVIKLQFSFGMSLGTETSCAGSFTAGVSTLSDGTVRGIHEFSVDYNNSSLKIKGDIEYSLKISAGLDILVMHGLIYGDIGLTTEASQETHYVDDDGDGKLETIVCNDIQEYFTLKVGYNVKLLKTIILSDSTSVTSGSNKNQPILFRIHFENGDLVYGCRFGMSVKEPDFGSKFVGGVNAEEIDWSKRNLDVAVTLYDDLELEKTLTISSNGGIDLNGHTLIINGDLIQEVGTININGGKLVVKGDYRIQRYDEKEKSYGDSAGSLVMQGEKDELEVDGDFYTQSGGDYSNYVWNYLDGGTITLKGNFSQLKGDENNFRANETKVIFAGSETQEISFETPESSYFRYPVFKNQDIRVMSGIGRWNLNEDIVIRDEGYPLEIVGGMNLTNPNGNTLTVERSVIIRPAGGGDINLDNGKLEIKGDLTQKAGDNGYYVNFNQGSLEVEGNLLQEAGQMNINEGKLEVAGDYRIQRYNEKKKSYEDSEGSLVMNGEEVEVIVGGDFYTQSTVDDRYYYNHFYDGTMTLKGNFSQLKGNVNNFRAEGTKVIFAGTDTQEISFATPESSYFRYPVFENQNIRVTSGIGRWNLNEDLVIKDEGYPLEIVGGMNLTNPNGNTLTVERSVIIRPAEGDGDINLDNGKLEIKGDLTQKAGDNGYYVNFNQGSLEVEGNLLQEAGQMNINEGKLEVAGDYRIQRYNEKKKSYEDSEGSLVMNGEEVEVIVGGDFYTQSTVDDRYYYNHFYDGTMTLKGNFSQLKGNVNNFRAEGTKVIFAGTDTQEISFATPESSYFRYPVFENQDIRVTSGIGRWNLNEDLVIKDEGYPLEIVGGMNLTNPKGNTLTVERSVIVRPAEGDGDINLDNGRLEIKGDLTQKAGDNGYYVNFNQGNLEVEGNLLQEAGVMNITEGKLEVAGDYRIQKYNEKKQSYENSEGALRMGEEGELTVGGDFYTQSSDEYYNSFDGGTMTLKGNFHQLKGAADNFRADGTKVVFAGTTTQEISFATPESSYFRYPVFENQDIRVTSGIGRWNLNEDLVIKDEGYPLEIVGGMNLTNPKGNTLIVERSVVIKPTGGEDDINLDNGKLEIKGDLTQKAGDNGYSINFNQGSMEVEGNLLQEAGEMNINGGKLEVTGDYRIQKYNEKKQSYENSEGALALSEADAELTVGGDFYTQSSDEYYNSFDGGTMTLKGNFHQLKGAADNFRADGTKVVFAGTDTQEISFATPESSYFRYPVFENKDIRIMSGIGRWNLNDDLVIKDEGYPLEIIGGIILHNNTLTVERNVIIKPTEYGGDIELNNGTIKVKGDLTQKAGENGYWMHFNQGNLEVEGNLLQEAGGMDINGGKLEVTGDYRIQKYNEKKQSYENSEGALALSEADAELTVGGDFYTQSIGWDGYNYNNFSDGTMTLKGNFYQLAGSEVNFRADGTKVVFAGTATQEISFATPENSYFRYPIFKNKDIRVKSGIGRWNLNEDLVIKDEGYPLEIIGGMNLTNPNGNTLTVERSVIIKSSEYDGNIDLNNGTIKIMGDLTQKAGYSGYNVNFNQGNLEVEGNLLQEAGVMNITEGKLEVAGDYRIQKYNEKKQSYENSEGALRMGEEGELTVGGDFYTQSSDEYYNSFDGGTMTLKGNFHQLKGAADNFRADETKVVFDGKDLQEVYIETPSASHISNPVYKNTKVCYMGTRKIGLTQKNTILKVALPENANEVSKGIVYSEDAKPTLDTQGRTRVAFTETTDNAITFDASGLEGNTFRAYIVIKDVAGDDHVFYTEPVGMAG